MMIFLLLSINVNVSVFTQFPHFVLITICHHVPVLSSLDSISLSNTVCEALSHPGWRSAMVEEMQALDDNGTCNLIQLPARKKAIGCRWIFAVKVNPDGSVTCLKAGLVAKGYTHTYGVDYSDICSAFYFPSCHS